MNKKRLRARAGAAYDELDEEIAEVDSVEAEERADLLRRFKEMKNDPAYQEYQKSKAKSDSVSVSGKTKDVVSSKPDSSSSKTKRYDDSVTKTTTTPTTRNGRKGTETKTVTSGTMTGGKSDNPEMQKQHDWFRIKNKYGGLIRAHGRDNIRKQIADGPAPEELKLFDTVFPDRKKK